MNSEGKTRDQLIIELEARTRELAQANKELHSEISERRLITEVLRLEENQYTDLADLLPQTIYEAAESGNLIFVNRRAFEYFGYTQEDFDAGLNIIQMVAPQEREKVREAFQKSLSGEKHGKGMEIIALRKDGTTFPALSFSSPVVQGDQNIGVRGLIIDITERKAREEELQDVHERILLLATGQQKFLESERLRISREIQDGLSEKLKTVKMELTGVSKKLPEIEKEKLETVFKLVDTMVGTVEKICSELKP
jgi:PAS domain S-box-containing protein